MTQLSPIENLFAVEVPEDAKNITIKNGAYVKWLMIDGNPFIPINDPAKFRILFTTKDCSEEQAAGVVDSHWDTKLGAMRYGVLKNNTMDNFLPTEALSGLLRANGLNPETNILLIKKIA